MIVGVDFDNTIVRYDALFYRIALERHLIPAELPATKTAVRDYLRRVGNEPAWTEMQGYVYGPRLREAEIYPGVKEFFRECRANGVVLKIISHKTRHPYLGKAYDLHAAALNWLEVNGFFSTADFGLSREAVFLELTKRAKLMRIEYTGCNVFIDDLPEFLDDVEFPRDTQGVLFDPMDVFTDHERRSRATSWAEITNLLFGSEKSPRAECEIQSDAAALMKGAGLHLGAVPIRIVGGANNRVFDVRTEQGDRYLLKQYFPEPGEARNRFEAERLFYRFTAITAPGATPRGLGWNTEKHLALLEFIDGRKLSVGEVGVEELNEAFSFFVSLNRGRKLSEAQSLPLAAEACFSLEEHCAAVDKRLKRLKEIRVTTSVDSEAQTLIENDLAAAWNDARAEVLAHDSGDPIPAEEHCVSPSDFGFHNCLRRTDGRLVFLDFEYSGWDDPAKAMCDFFCQPAIPAPLSEFNSMVNRTATALGLSSVESFSARCRLLLPLYRLKWCMIMLNEFNQVDRARRAFALGEKVAKERKATQLAAARRALASWREPIYGTIA